jgi:hypothetical protein
VAAGARCGPHPACAARCLRHRPPLVKLSVDVIICHGMEGGPGIVKWGIAGAIACGDPVDSGASPLYASSGVTTSDNWAVPSRVGGTASTPAPRSVRAPRAGGPVAGWFRVTWR